MGNVKIVFKVIIYILLAVIAAEVIGAIFDAAYPVMRMNSIVSVVSSNNGQRQESKTFIERDDRNKTVYTQTIILLYTKNISDISMNVESKVSGSSYEIIPLADIYKDKSKAEAVSGYAPDYGKYKKKMNLRENEDKENYYIISIWEEAPFKHNHLIYYLDYFTDK